MRRIPRFAEQLEIIFVEGHSKDGTWDEIRRVVAAYPHHDIKAMQQPGKGKADAVFAAFDVASGDALMILDADLTMPPNSCRSSGKPSAPVRANLSTVRGWSIRWKTKPCASST